MTGCTMSGADTLFTFSGTSGTPSASGCALLSTLTPSSGDPPPYIVNNMSPANVNLQNNYWGSAFAAEPAQLPRLIHDVFDDIAVGEVMYLPLSATSAVGSS